MHCRREHDVTLHVNHIDSDSGENRQTIIQVPIVRTVHRNDIVPINGPSVDDDLAVTP